MNVSECVVCGWQRYDHELFLRRGLHGTRRRHLRSVPARQLQACQRIEPLHAVRCRKILDEPGTVHVHRLLCGMCRFVSSHDASDPSVIRSVALLTYIEVNHLLAASCSTRPQSKAALSRVFSHLKGVRVSECFVSAWAQVLHLQHGLHQLHPSRVDASRSCQPKP